MPSPLTQLRVRSIARPAASRVAFTLVELLVTISIIALLAAIALGVLGSAQESARDGRTRALIAKLSSIVLQKYENFQYRNVPVYLGNETSFDRNNNGTIEPTEQVDFSSFYGGSRTPTAPGLVPPWPAPMPPALAAKRRLDAIHELMRLEMPDRWTDIIDDPQTLLDAWTDTNNDGKWDSGEPFVNEQGRPAPRQMNYPSITQAMRRELVKRYNLRQSTNLDPSLAASFTTILADNAFSKVNQSAELLYLLVTIGLDDELSFRELMGEGNVGDTDENGLKEFLDGWGEPIQYCRWPAGFPSELTGRPGEIISVNSQTNGSITTDTIVVGSSYRTPQYYTPKVILFTKGNPDASGSQRAGFAQRVATYNATTFEIVVNWDANQLQSPPPLKAGDLFQVIDFDPLDASSVYPSATQFEPTFLVYPLIFSKGPDKQSDLELYVDTVRYGAKGGSFIWRNNNPYTAFPSTSASRLEHGLCGAVFDFDGDGDNSLDNIHNHSVNKP